MFQGANFINHQFLAKATSKSKCANRCKSLCSLKKKGSILLILLFNMAIVLSNDNGLVCQFLDTEADREVSLFE